MVTEQRKTQGEHEFDKSPINVGLEGSEQNQSSKESPFIKKNESPTDSSASALNTSGPIEESTQQVSDPPLYPDSKHPLPMDDEAKALLSASYRIGAASNAPEYHSYSGLLVAFMLSNNPASRWLRRRLSELKIEPAAQKVKLGLTEEELMQLASDTYKGDLPTKRAEWSQSAQRWFATALDFVRRRSEAEQHLVTARDLVAAFVDEPENRSAIAPVNRILSDAISGQNSGPKGRHPPFLLPTVRVPDYFNLIYCSCSILDPAATA